MLQPEVPLQQTEQMVKTLLIINVLALAIHIYRWCDDIFYFFKLTIIGQTLVIANFYLSLILHERKSKLKIRLLLSRLHLLTIGLESIVVIGFWSLKIFMPTGINTPQDMLMDNFDHFLSFWVHGGSLLTLVYFIKTNQLITQTKKSIKLLYHLGWGIPYAILQIIHFQITDTHIYGFIQEFNFAQLVVFEVGLYAIAVTVDYVVSIRHGYQMMFAKERIEDKRQIQRQKTNPEQ